MLEDLLWTLLGLVALATGLLAVPVEVAASLDVSADNVKDLSHI